MDIYTECSYSVALELPDGSEQVVWLAASSREEAEKEVAGTGVKVLREYKTITVVESICLE